MKEIFITALIYFMAVCGVKAQHTGYIYLDSVFATHSSYPIAKQQFQATKNTYEKELAEIQKNLDTRFEVLLAKYNVKDGEKLETIKLRMNAVDTLSLSFLLDEEKTLQNKIKSYDNMLKFTYERDIEPIKKEIMEAISAYARKHKYDAVFIAEKIAGSHIYLNPERDITQDIILILSSSKDKDK